MSKSKRARSIKALQELVASTAFSTRPLSPRATSPLNAIVAWTRTIPPIE